MPKGVPNNRRPDSIPKHNARGAGRKRINLDWDLIDKYLIAGASGVQIAAVLNVHPQTLYFNCIKDKNCDFTNYSFDKRQLGNAYLHQMQFKKAMEGNIVMLMRLGEHRLGQCTKIEQKTEVNAQIKQKVIMELPDNGRRNKDQASNRSTN